MSSPKDKPTKDTSGYLKRDIREANFEDLIEMDAGRLENTSNAVLAMALSHFKVDDRRTFLRIVSEEKASEILSEMDDDDAAEVVGAMRESRAVKMLEELDPDDAVDVVQELEEPDRQRLLEAMEPEAASEINYLLSYDPDTAGGIMTTEVATIGKNQTIEEAIQEVRRQREELEQIYYFYVVDEDMRLEGVVSLRELLLAPSGTLIKDTMKSPVEGVCIPSVDKEAVSLAMAEHNLTALPVTDEDGRLIGMVTHDDILDVVQEEATEDIQKMVGAGADESIFDPIRYSIQKRNPWLIVNLITISMASAVIYFYEEQIAKITILAVLMPIVANLGGNTGAQTLAVLIRGLAVGEIRDKDTLQICIRESLKGITNGIIIATIACLLTWGLTGELLIALVVFLALTLTMGFAGLAGAFIPLFLKKLKFDPAQSSSIFLTGVVDIVGFLIFLQLGAMLLF